MASNEAFLRRAVDHIRLYCMDTIEDVLWSEAKLVELIDTANMLVFDEALSTAEPKTYSTLAETDLSIVSGTEDYTLPGNCRRTLRVVHKNPEGNCDRELLPVDLLSGIPGIVLFGRARGFRIVPKPTTSETWTVQYLAGPTPCLHYGTAQSAASTNIVLATSATLGTVMTDPNYYVNSWVRIVSAGNASVGQTRRITAYSGSTKTATVAAWDVAPTGTIVYEIMPCLDPPLDKALMWRAAMMIKASDGDYRHRGEAQKEYRDILRTVLSQSADLSGRTGPTIGSDFMNPEDFGGY